MGEINYREGAIVGIIVVLIAVSFYGIVVNI